MPCYLFTFHGHGTWMPDHVRGYVRRGRGVLPTDEAMAAAYRAKQKEPMTKFGPDEQAVLVEVARAAGEYLGAVVHAVACEPTHVHVLVSWDHDRPWKAMRTSIRWALTRALNKALGKRTWFSDSPSRKRVRGWPHLDYLVLWYLPSHDGRTWARERTVALAQQRDAGREVSVIARAKKRKSK